MGILKITSTGRKEGNEMLSINKSGRKVNATVKIFRFIDKDTNQFVAYCPAFEVSGYGENKSKATNMLRFSIEEHFEYLLDLPQKKLEAELRQQGWAHNKLENKKYSKAFVDIQGQLQNFNALNDKVEELTLSAA